MKVAVIGASGFIGSRMVEWLLLNNVAQVRPVVRSFKGMARLARFELDIRIADACNQEGLEEVIRGVDVIFHCVVGDRNTILRSAQAVYRACSKARVGRLVYLSSAVVHGHDPAPCTSDDSELVDRQPFAYNVSKVRAERLLRRLRADGVVEVVTLRPMIVFGPRSLWWSAQIAMDMVAGKSYLVDGGLGICNTVYVDNLVHAMWLAAMAPEAAGQDFIITDGQKVTWVDLYAAVGRAVGIEVAQVANVDDRQARIWRANQASERRREIIMSLKPFVSKAIWPLVPSSMKNTLRRRIADKLVGAEYQEQGLALDPVIVSLQKCRYQLPISKAQRLLGYDPPVTFADGCARTEAWLRFALGMDDA